MVNNIEYLGFLATLLVIASFLFQNVVLIRGVNALGAILWIVYGILMGCPSVAVLNAVVVCIQAVQLIRLHNRNKNSMPVDGKFKVSVLKQ